MATSEQSVLEGESAPLMSTLGIGDRPAKEIREATHEYICAVSRRPTRSELDMARQVQIEVDRVYEHKKRQLYALALTESGNTIGAPQADFGNGSNVCAEMAVFFKNSAPVQRLVTLVVAHKNNPEGENPGHVHLAMPCGACRERLLEHHPDIEIIFSYRGEILVARLEALLPLVFKRRNGKSQKHSQ